MEPPTAAATVAVLTNRALFALAASLLPGLPRVVLDFARANSSWVASRMSAVGVLPKLAIATCDLAMLRRLHAQYQQQQRASATRDVDVRLAFDSVMAFAAQYGEDAASLQWLHDHTELTCEPKTLIYAATMGRLETAKWLAAHRADACASVMTSPCDAIALTGNLEMLQFLVRRFPGLLLTSDAMDYAAAEGHLPMVHFLHETRLEGCTTGAMDHAARTGRLDIVRFLHEHRTEGCTADAMDYAAAGGHLEIVRFLHAHRREGCSVNAMDEAAKNGHLDIVRFLHENRTEGCTTYAMDMTAWGGHVDVLQFLHDHRREGFTPMAIGKAAQLGHLEVVRFLHEHQVGERNCHEDALHEAARFGHTDIVKYLLENCTKGCLFTARKCAEERAFDEVLALLVRYIRPGVETAASATTRLATRSVDARGS